MEYNQLTTEQKSIINTIEQIYFKHKAMTQKDFIVSLAFVLNKYKKI